MNKALSSIAIIVLCLTIGYVVVNFKTCKAQTITTGQIVNPDTNYNPVIKKEYRKPLITLSKTNNSGFKLPSGVKENDIKRVVTLKLKAPSVNPIDVIEAKNGMVYIAKDYLVESVTITDFQPPICEFNPRVGAGITIGLRDNHIKLSPVITFAPEIWYGWIHIPIVTADLEGVGAGMQIKLYHDIYVGAVQVWNFDKFTQVKLTANFMF